MKFFLFFKHFFLITASIFYFLCVQANHTLDHISPSDKENLYLLFEYLFKSHESFAYTLFGDKPMSFSLIIKPDPSMESILDFIRIDEYALFLLKENNLPSVFYEQAWNKWESIASLKMKRFLFLKRNIENFPAIFLINKEAFHKTINTHIKLFKNLLGKDINSEKILSQIEQENADIDEILHHHDSLLGILLGFGKHNSLLFEKREILEKKLKRLAFIQSEKTKIIKKELDKLWDILKLRNDYYISDLAMGNSIAFVADRNHLESKFLEKKYCKQATKISQIYSKNNWFEQTLLQLMLD
jgi:hypothetical protein